MRKKSKSKNFKLNRISLRAPINILHPQEFMLSMLQTLSFCYIIVKLNNECRKLKFLL